MKLALIALVTAGYVAAQGTVLPWGTCGGIGWTGGTVCSEGQYCQYWNAWDSTCVPIATTTTTVDPTQTASSA